MLTPRTTTLALAISSLLLASQGANAALTTFDADYDGRAVLYLYSLKVIRTAVDNQNSEWLTTEFEKTLSEVNNLIESGDITLAKYLGQVTAFYETTKTKYPDFDRKASNALDENAFSFAEFHPEAPEAFSDYMLDTATEVAKERKTAGADAKIEAARTDIEKSVKSKESAAVMDGKFIALYTELDALDAGFLAAFDVKNTEFFNEYLEESDKTAVEMPSATTTAPPAKDSSLASAAGSGSGSKNGTNPSSPATTAPAATSAAVSISTMAGVAATVVGLAITLLM